MGVVVKICLTIFLFSTSYSFFSQSSGRLQIMSWNVFLRPAFLKDNQVERAYNTSSFLITKDYDVITLQEVFHKKARNILIDELKTNYPYYTREGKKSIFGVNSGLITFSKYPLKKSRFVYFDNLTGSDKLSKKGALSTIIVIGEIQLNIVNTHFQAGTKEKKDEIRLKQARQITTLKNPSDSIVIYAGDFNIAFNSPQYKNLKKEIGIDKKLPKLQSITKNTANFSDHNLFPSKGKPVRIDHIFIDVIKGSSKLYQLKVLEPRVNNQRLSDHNPIEGCLIFDAN